MLQMLEVYLSKPNLNTHPTVVIVINAHQNPSHTPELNALGKSSSLLELSYVIKETHIQFCRYIFQIWTTRQAHLRHKNLSNTDSTIMKAPQIYM
jgi:hypothetical protein